MMGILYSEDDGPMMCFNAAKSWQFGWYSSRQQIFNAGDGIWSGRLIGQVDMKNANANTDDKVLIKLNTGTSTDYYAMLRPFSVQGFFTQFGYAAGCYNPALSLYYYLTINRGMKKEEFSRVIEKVLHVGIVGFHMSVII
mmetsp:Transcript_32405/g.68153  ORF Transcript_32405/g.68153 Transcript_32405/m.68153 type:complete len:140 (+) Transcript_32405:1330-1749(+)